MDDYEVLSRSSLPHKSLAINLKFEHGGEHKGSSEYEDESPWTPRFGAPLLLLGSTHCHVCSEICINLFFPLPLPSFPVFLFGQICFWTTQADSCSDRPIKSPLSVCTSADVTGILHDVELFMTRMHVWTSCCWCRCGRNVMHVIWIPRDQNSSLATNECNPISFTPFHLGKLV